MSAVRLARGFTRRAKIIKFDGCYHGHFDDFLVAAGSGVAALPSSSSQGISDAHVKDTLSLPYNDVQELGLVIERYGHEIAAVIVEPVAGNMGVIVPDKAFLKALRRLTAKYGIVLIFDEVMTGFRSNLGGAQADFGVIPDLTCLGKIIGGGFPVGAYGGRKDIMKHLAPLGGVYQAGTFAGNPLVMRVGLAVLEQLTPSVYKGVNSVCDDFVRDVNGFLSSRQVAAHLANYKSMVSIRFSSQAVGNYAQAQAASSNALYSRLFQHLLKNEVYLPPADLESFFISTKHRPQDIRHLSNLLKKFFNLYPPGRDTGF